MLTLAGQRMTRMSMVKAAAMLMAEEEVVGEGEIHCSIMKPLRGWREG
jgi:hypothetical protein